MISILVGGLSELYVSESTVGQVQPPYSTHTKDNLVLLASCNDSDPLQRWRYRAAPGAGGKRMLRVVTCNSSDPYQQWKKHATTASVNGSFGLANVGLGLALDSSVGGSMKWETRAPLGFAAFTGTAAQLFSLTPTAPVGNANSNSSSSSSGRLVDAHDRQCLNVVSLSGPDVGLDPCKPAGAGDNRNEIFEVTERSGSIQITNAGSGLKCLAASATPAGGFLYTVDEAGAEWCLVADGGRGSVSTSMSGQPCAAVDSGVAAASSTWQLGEVSNGTIESLSLGGSQFLTWGNRQFGASGPLPHHVYLQATPWATPAWRWPDALTTHKGAAVQLPPGINLTDDDHVGGVKQVDSSTLCMALTRGGNLETWVSVLSGHRLAVAFFNRGIETARVRQALLP
jgi:hypothetical protein